MKVQISDIPEGGTDIRCEIPPGQVKLNIEGVRAESPVEGEVSLRKTGERVEATGSVKASFKLTCSRCLETFSQEIKTSYHLFYGPASPGARAGQDVELHRDDFDKVYYRDPVIDVARDMCQSLTLALRLAPLCRADCRGLCPVCGADRNQRQCDCRPEKAAPRWAALAKWQEKIKEASGPKSDL